MTEAASRIVAFMDMGTNSVRLMIVRISPNQTYTILSRQKEMIRLGSGEFDDGELKEDAMARAVLVSRNFVSMAHSFQADEIVAVATSATRDARNQRDFLKRLRSEAHLDVQVISGQEEARLIYLGVSRGIQITERSLFMDIGGGSTELVVGDGKGYEMLSSLKLGAIRLTDLFLSDRERPVTARMYQAMQDHVRGAVIRPLEKVRALAPRKAYGSSGTIQNLAEIACQALYAGDAQRRELLKTKDLKQVVEMLCASALKERARIPGMNPRRADIIVGGAVILSTILTDLGLSEIRVSNRELRDGLLMDYLYRSEHPLMDAFSVREHSVLRLARRCQYDERHAATVARLALDLFDGAKAIGLHKQGPSKRELLYYAALLHDVGSFLSYANHHRGGYFFIRNADLLGFTQGELALMAVVVFFHRKMIPSRKIPEFAELDERGQETARPQAIFLRMAESLDRSHAALVQGVSLCRVDKRTVMLTLRSPHDCQLEHWGVQNHCEAFEKVFGVRLVIQHGQA